MDTLSSLTAKACLLCVHVCVMQVPLSGLSHHEGKSYVTAVKNLSAIATELLGDATQTLRLMQKKKGSYSQHTISLSGGYTSPEQIEAAHPLLGAAVNGLFEEHIRPYLRRIAADYGEVKVNRFFVSRNENDEQLRSFESWRTRAMLWHWDNLFHAYPGGLGLRGLLKVILYLNPDGVDGANGCMLAVRHNESGKPLVLNGHRHSIPWGPGGANDWPVVPQLWLSELAAEGYHPQCLSGPMGTLVVFNTDVVHRGSRPANGRYRDFVLWELLPKTPPPRWEPSL